MARAKGIDLFLNGAIELSEGVNPGSGYFRRYPVEIPDFSKEQPNVDSLILGNGRQMAEPTRGFPVSGGTFRVPYDFANTGFWHRLMLGAPTSVGVVAATGGYRFSAQPQANATIGFGNVIFTFVTGTPTGNQIQIGGTLPATINNAVTALNASVDAMVARATYSAAGSPVDTLLATADILGGVGNTYQVNNPSVTSNATRLNSSAVFTGGISAHTFTGTANTLDTASIELEMAPASQFEMLLGWKADRLEVGFTTENAIPTFSITGMAINKTNNATSQAGTLLAPYFNGEQRLLARTLTSISRNGVVHAEGTTGTLTIANNLERVATTGRNGLPSGHDEGQIKVSGTITARASDRTWVDQAENFENVTLLFKLDSPDGCSVEYTVHRCKLEPPRNRINGPAGVDFTCNFTGFLNPATSNTITAVIRSPVAGYTN